MAKEEPPGFADGAGQLCAGSSPGNWWTVHPRWAPVIERSRTPTHASQLCGHGLPRRGNQQKHRRRQQQGEDEVSPPALANGSTPVNSPQYRATDRSQDPDEHNGDDRVAELIGLLKTDDQQQRDDDAPQESRALRPGTRVRRTPPISAPARATERNTSLRMRQARC